MFGIGEKIKHAAAASGALALAGTIALLGLVWLTIAAYLWLSTVVVPAAAAAIVGGVAMLPALGALLRLWPHAKPEPEPIAAAIDHDASALLKLAQGATILAEKSPILGAALTLGAAFVASRSPVTSALAVQMLAEAVERWTHSSSLRKETAPDA